MLFRSLASILWDEYGCGNPARTHPAQFRKALRALELDVAAVERAPRLPQLEEYSRVHFGMCTPATFWTAMGAVGFAMEWPVPYMYEPLVRGYRRIAGLSDDDLEFFLEHIPTDETHSSLMIASVRPYLDDADVRDALMDGALRSLDTRERLVEAICRRMEAGLPAVTR